MDASVGAGEGLAGATPAELDQLGRDRDGRLLGGPRAQVKADRRAVPDDLAAALAARADAVVFSRGEATFVARAFAAARPGARPRLSVETRGSLGVAIDCDGVVEIVPADPIEAADSTGAGDTFLGGFLAALVGGAQPRDAAQAGAAAARALLTTRTEQAKRG